jgi:hypothetical protein
MPTTLSVSIQVVMPRDRVTWAISSPDGEKSFKEPGVYLAVHRDGYIVREAQFAEPDSAVEWFLQALGEGGDHAEMFKHLRNSLKSETPSSWWNKARKQLLDQVKEELDKALATIVARKADLDRLGS